MEEIINTIPAYTSEPLIQTAIQPGIDLTYLINASNGDVNFVKEMMKSLIPEIDEKMESLRTCLLSGEAKKGILLAHSLKTLCHILGMDTLYNQFSDIELNYEITTSLVIQKFSFCEAQWQQARLLVKKAIDADQVSS